MAAVVVFPRRDAHALSTRTDSIARCGLCSYANSLRSRIHQNTRRLFSRYSRLMFQLRRGAYDSALPRHLDSGQRFAAIRRSDECQLHPLREFRVVIPGYEAARARANAKSSQKHKKIGVRLSRSNAVSRTPIDGLRTLRAEARIV